MKQEQDFEIPTTLEECYSELDNIFSGMDFHSNENESIFDDLISGKLTTARLHFGLGQTLRNQWGMWSGSELSKYFNNIGIHHADDMYAIIMDSYISKLKGEEYDLDGAVKYYQEYWEKNK